MASRIFERYQQEAEDQLSQITNVEFVTKVVDSIIDEHTSIDPIDHPDGSVTTEKLDDGAVTTSKISNFSITHEKLNPNMNLRGKTVIVDTPTVGIDVDPDDPPPDGGESSLDMQIVYDLLNTLGINLRQYTDGRIVSYDDEMIRPYTDSRIDEIRDEMDTLNDTVVEGGTGTFDLSKEYTDGKIDILDQKIDYNNDNNIYYLNLIQDVIGLFDGENFDKVYWMGDTFHAEDLGIDLTIVIGDEEYSLQSMRMIDQDKNSTSIAEGYVFDRGEIFDVIVDYGWTDGNISKDLTKTYLIKVIDPDGFNGTLLDVMKEKMSKNLLRSILQLRSQIVDLIIDTDRLMDGSVTGPKLDDGSVSERTILDDAVTEHKISDGSVTGSKLSQDIIDRLDSIEDRISDLVSRIEVLESDGDDPG